jgi:hypothetical protein
MLLATVLVGQAMVYWWSMTRLLEEAVRVLRDLPEDRQEAAARAILNYGADDDEVQLSDEDVAEIERRIADPNRKFLSLAELDKRIRRLGV